MKQVNIHQAKANLSRLLVELEEQGEEIVIARYNKPVAKIVLFRSEVPDRKPGSAKGEIQLTERFFEPLPDEVLKAFEE